jgi:hypothetical protein
MIKTIFGNYLFEKKDFADTYAKYLIKEFESLPKHKIVVREDTDHGFLTNEKLSLVSGLYVIYKNDILVYIGETNYCIRQRIGRLLAGIRGTERPDENHSAAYKYIEYFGRDTSGLSFKYIPINVAELEYGIQLLDIENSIIEKMEPLFNKEIYKNYRFQKQLKITDVLGVNGETVVPL